VRPLAPHNLFARCPPRTVHQSVKMAKTVDGLLDGGFAIRLTGYVGRCKAHARAELCGDGLAGGSVDVRDDHLCAVHGKLAGDRSPKPRAAARDDKNAILDLHVPILLRQTEGRLFSLLMAAR
jgi:hypothetical protein